MKREREILRKQLELLAERSEKAVMPDEFSDFSNAMLDISCAYEKLEKTLFIKSFAVFAYFFIGVTVLFKNFFGRKS